MSESPASSDVEATLEHFEEEEFPEEPIDTVETLKEKQNEAIENLNFQLAGELQAQIEALSNDTSLSKIEDYKSQLTDVLTKCAKRNRQKRAKMLREWHAKELEERIKMNDSLDELKQQHLLELKAVEEKLFEVYKERMTKPIALYDELIERAKLTAKRCEFQQAQEFQDQADAARAAEEDKREELFKEVYKSRMKAVLEKQRSEILKLTADHSVSLEKVLKGREEDIHEREKAFKREMIKEYKRIVDTVTRAKYDPKKATQNLINRTLVPELLNELEDEYNNLMVKFGLESVEVMKKPKLIAPGVRPESQMSLRMQSRCETRETEKKKKDEERVSRMSERATSKQSSRSPSQQSPRSGSRAAVKNSE